MGQAWYRSRVVQGSVLGALILALGTIIAPWLSPSSHEAGPLAPPAVRVRTAAPSDSSTGGTPIDGRVWIGQRSAEELDRYIASQPPLSRQSTERVFIGSWVRWRGVVTDVLGGKRLYLVGTKAGRDSTRVGLELSLGQRPIVEPLREGDSIAYSGRIVYSSHMSFPDETWRMLFRFVVDSVVQLETVSKRGRLRR